MITRTVPAGSIALTPDGKEFAFTEGAEHTTNKVDKRLRFYAGEWIIDTRIGVPYHRDILGKKVPEPVTRSIFTQVIEGTPGVVRMTKLDIDFDNRTRTLTITWAAILEDGSAVSSSPFIIA